MNRSVWILGVALAALLTTACGNDPGDTPASEATFDDSPTPAPTDDRGPIDISPEEAKVGRSARRLTVDHLRQSIPMLFGGITWTVTVNNRTFNTFDGLAQTLGEPDYLEVTAANIEPNPIFAKFMDDMAGQVCSKAIERDKTTPDAADRLVVRHPDDVDANLRFLRLKLHGIYVPETATEGLTELRQLHTDILADTSDDALAWGGVCIAMLTAPEFMAY